MATSFILSFPSLKMILHYTRDVCRITHEITNRRDVWKQIFINIWEHLPCVNWAFISSWIVLSCVNQEGFMFYFTQPKPEVSLYSNLQWFLFSLSFKFLLWNLFFFPLPVSPITKWPYRGSQGKGEMCVTWRFYNKDTLPNMKPDVKYVYPRRITPFFLIPFQTLWSYTSH